MFDCTELVAPEEIPEEIPEEVDSLDFDPGPGPQWSSYLPDGLLADTLERQAGEGPQWERLERIGSWERVVAWAQANQLREMAIFAHAAEKDAARHAEERAPMKASGQPVAPEVAHLDGLESAAAEISLMLRIAPVTASSRLDDALTLTGRFPATMAALAAGRITLCKARIIAEQTEQLSADQAGGVESRVLQRATTQTPGQLRRSVRRAVAKADPVAVRRRHQAAKRERGVSLWELPDGMAMISACLPAGEAVGVYGVLDEYARATGGAGDDRTLPARRADALVDLVCGSAGYLSAGTRTREARMSRSERRRARRRRSRVGVQIRVTVPFSTLFGIDEQPGELAGYGTITAERARELAAQGTWRRILTDPATGAPTDYGTTVYRPPAALRDLVVTRTPICGFPSCLRSVHRGDLDHREPHNPSAGTGPTNEHNLDGYCRRHHRTKHTPGWSVRQGDHGTLIWTSPSGDTWTHEPPPITEPTP
jgi:muconolactone delta-isomerase